MKDKDILLLFSLSGLKGGVFSCRLRYCLANCFFISFKPRLLITTHGIFMRVSFVTEDSSEKLAKNNLKHSSRIKYRCFCCSLLSIDQEKKKTSRVVQGIRCSFFSNSDINETLDLRTNILVDI